MLLHRLADDIRMLDTRRFEGRLRSVKGARLAASGPDEALMLGARALIQAAKPIPAEVVGFEDNLAILLASEATEGVRPGALVQFDPSPDVLYPSRGWLGRVVDAYGNPTDGLGPLPLGRVPMPVKAQPPSAHTRDRVGERMDVGVKALNAFVAVCRGQRMGLFAGSGVGKSVLMSMLAKGAAADVIVIGLLGERGREVREFIEDTLGPEGLARSVVVVATSDEAAPRRRRSAWTALTIAEYFRDQGKDVLCLLDSVTRFAMAQREIGLAAGEPPTTKGYTPTVFAELPRLLERAGPGLPDANGHAGSITGLFTVLVDGGDHDEPIADAVRGILDGHLVMDRKIGERGRYPAIDVLKSVSRLMPHCHTREEMALVRRARQLMSAYADMEELIRIGAYQRGADPFLDEAIAKMPALDGFLGQAREEHFNIPETFAALDAALGQ